jgi:HD-GYP domain-containing protein (c-di-GMP phosphodiesterase class II)
MAYALAQKSGIDEGMCQRIKLAAPLHDIGTIGIDDEILTKQGKFTEKEKTAMQPHTEIGASILSKSERPVLKIASVMALQHHERWDGSGYPNGLKGEETDLSARIIGIVDMVDALRSHKQYRPAFKPDEVMKILKKEKGVSLDPVLTEHAIELMDDFQRIRLKYPDVNI